MYVFEMYGNVQLSNIHTLRAETFAGIKFRVKKKKKREIIDKNFRVWKDLSQISRKNFREFCVKLIQVIKWSNCWLKDIRDFA